MRHFFTTLHSLLQRVRRWARSVFFYDHWMVGIIDQPIGNALKWTEMPPVRWVAAFDKKRYFADPFPWPGSADTLLCEQYDTATQRGHIQALRLDDTGINAEVKVGLPLPGHLSFPFLFMCDGVVFAMPEASSSRLLEIFRWEEARGLWVSHAVVFDNKPVADAILFDRDGYFWIAYTDLTQGSQDNLHLIFAPELTGPWTAHPANPIRRGREASRNGGAVFEIGERMFRPAQDCTSIYGGALRIMEITTCTPQAYAEREITHIVPASKAYPDGVHTLNAWGDKCLVDGMRLTFSLRLLWGKIKRRLYIFR